MPCSQEKAVGLVKKRPWNAFQDPGVLLIGIIALRGLIEQLLYPGGCIRATNSSFSISSA